MKIFVLDDMLERHKTFKKRFPTAEIIFTTTADEAIEVLGKSLDYDKIFLDHDLGMRIFVDTEDKNTGSTVAKWLADKEINCPIIIHSCNYVGAKNMLSYLPNAKHIPFIFI